jgi:hypothetical protein
MTGLSPFSALVFRGFISTPMPAIGPLSPLFSLSSRAQARDLRRPLFLRLCEKPRQPPFSAPPMRRSSYRAPQPTPRTCHAKPPFHTPYPRRYTSRPRPEPVMLSRPFTRPTGAQGPLCPILTCGRFAPRGLPYLIFAPFPHGCFSLTKKRQASPALSRAGPAIPLCPSPLYRPSPLPRGGPKAEPLPRRC